MKCHELWHRPAVFFLNQSLAMLFTVASYTSCRVTELMKIRAMVRDINRQD
jgi:hypothetical protein